MTMTAEMKERVREAVLRRENEMAPADIILRQMGGSRRLNVMIGAKDFFSEDEGRTLVFKFPNRGAKRPNAIKVTLTGRDDYDVEFGRITRKKEKFPDGFSFYSPVYKVLKTYNNVYADQLKGLFESETGLYLSL